MPSSRIRQGSTRRAFMWRTPASPFDMVTIIEGTHRGKTGMVVWCGMTKKSAYMAKVKLQNLRNIWTVYDNITKTDAPHDERLRQSILDDQTNYDMAQEFIPPVKLVDAMWQSEKAIGIDVLLVHLATGTTSGKRLFFPKTYINIENECNGWFFRKKIQEIRDKYFPEYGREGKQTFPSSKPEPLVDHRAALDQWVIRRLRSDGQDVALKEEDNAR